ncbi:hypothetical protein [Marivita sp.]|uniref:hypothetical protein n=1 Tax=Marivita sp. TaxID=2003365 RepID=UPI003F71D400
MSFRLWSADATLIVGSHQYATGQSNSVRLVTEDNPLDGLIAAASLGEEGYQLALADSSANLTSHDISTP